MKQKLTDTLKKMKIVLNSHPVLEMLLLSIFILLTINQVILSRKLNSIKRVIEIRKINLNHQMIINSIKINEVNKILKIKTASVRKKKLLELIKKKEIQLRINKVISDSIGLSNQIINDSN